MNWSVIGHEKQKTHLQKLLADGALPHAYLFAGPEGVGKRMMAEDIAAVLVPQGYALDRLTLAPERDEDGKIHAIPVEAIRNLKSWVAMRPTGLHKVAIIDDADWMGGDAANTMLKMLEEPPAYAHFFLTTSRPGSTLSTITSRCQRMDFYPLDEAEMRLALKKQKFSEDDRALVSAVALGRPGAAIRLAGGKRLTKVAKAIAGLERVLKSGLAERLVYAKEVAEDDDVADVVRWWLAWTRTHLGERPQLASVATGLLELNETLIDPVFNRRLALDRFFLDLPVRQ
jgi:DNA polymerase-3 subunit delta'